MNKEQALQKLTAFKSDFRALIDKYGFEAVHNNHGEELSAYGINSDASILHFGFDIHCPSCDEVLP